MLKFWKVKEWNMKTHTFKKKVEMFFIWNVYYRNNICISFRIQRLDMEGVIWKGEIKSILVDLLKAQYCNMCTSKKISSFEVNEKYQNKILKASSKYLEY